MYAVLATSWALFSGPTHYISLATAAFYGVGAYVVAIRHRDAALPGAAARSPALAGGVLALLVGVATLRLSGVYFVIFTLGLAEFIRQIVTWVQNNFTGSRGLYVLTDITDRHIYWQLLALGALVALVGWVVRRSRLGFALRIIGNDELVAAHCGIHSPRAKVALFVISGVFAAVVGAVMAPRFTYIEPSIAFSRRAVVPGRDHGAAGRRAPAVGAAGRRHPVHAAVGADLGQLPDPDRAAAGPVAFLLIVYFIPHGVVGLLEKLRPRRARPTGARTMRERTVLDVQARQQALRRPARGRRS